MKRRCECCGGPIDPSTRSMQQDAFLAMCRGCRTREVTFTEVEKAALRASIRPMPLDQERIRRTVRECVAAREAQITEEDRAVAADPRA